VEQAFKEKMKKMKNGVIAKFSGNQAEIEKLVAYIEKRFVVVKTSRFIENDDGGHHIYVTVVGGE
jgi:hypothetical protein